MKETLFHRDEIQKHFEIIYPPDYDIARLIAQELESPDVTKTAKMSVKGLARHHALVGTNRLRLAWGLNSPRHTVEELRVESLKPNFDEEAWRVRCEKLSHQPLTEKLLDFLVEDMEERVEDCSKLLRIVSQIVLNQNGKYSVDQWEPIASYHARELLRSTSFMGSQLNHICDEIENIRFKAGRGMIEIGVYGGNCSYFVWSQIIGHASKHWFNCVRTAEKSRTNPNYLYETTASHLFWESIFSSLPQPQQLLNRIFEEQAVVRLALRKRAELHAPPTVSMPS